MYESYCFCKVFVLYAKKDIKIWVGDSRGKKGIISFLKAEFEKSFIEKIKIVGNE